MKSVILVVSRYCEVRNSRDPNIARDSHDLRISRGSRVKYVEYIFDVIHVFHVFQVFRVSRRNHVQ